MQQIYATVGQQNGLTLGNQVAFEIRLNEFAE
jgi:hypothetical protein